MADVSLVGLHGGEWFGAAAGAALREAHVLIGSARHLAAVPGSIGGQRVELTMPVTAVLDLAAHHLAAGRRPCIVASGDPGFFGLARLASARFGREGVAIHPAPSAVSLAFARVGTNWDDAVVVTAHGRALDTAAEAVRRHPKVAVLTSPDQQPEALGRVLAGRCGAREVTVCSRLGATDESVTRCDLDGLASREFDPMSVVVFCAPAPSEPGLAWGLPETQFDHRDGMITKAEVRAVALGKLDLPAAGVLWDVGAGSGSVALECARLRPGLDIYAVERAPADLERLRANTALTGVRVVAGEAPAALDALPGPDRAFVGGGGLAVLEAVVTRLRPGGTVVATYAAIDRAAAAASRLGNVVEIGVSRGVSLPDGSIRLEAENPVFVCWGPA